MYQAQAQDPENAFNWFYQQLVEKAKQESNQTAMNGEPGHEEGCDGQSDSNSKSGHGESCQDEKVNELSCKPTIKSTEATHPQENKTACHVDQRNDLNKEYESLHSKESENAVLGGLQPGQ